MKNNIEFSKIETVSKSEKLIKQWSFAEETKFEKQKYVNVSKVEITDKRLILSEQKGNEAFRKCSYKIENIKAVNYSITQSFKMSSLATVLMVLGVLALIVSVNLFITHTSLDSTITQGIVTLVFGIAMLAAGIYLIKNKKVNSKVRLVIETIKTEPVKFMEAATNSNKNIFTSKNINEELELLLTPKVIEMCTTLDNIILDIQSNNFDHLLNNEIVEPKNVDVVKAEEVTPAVVEKTSAVVEEKTEVDEVKTKESSQNTEETPQKTDKNATTEEKSEENPTKKKRTTKKSEEQQN